MTSSLVGSEMCIRDRLQHGINLVLIWEEITHHAPIAQVLNDNSATSETVSYTHLTLPTICSV
eukprot:2682396-Prorocentrum_lima.AAC.1